MIRAVIISLMVLAGGLMAFNASPKVVVEAVSHPSDESISLSVSVIDYRKDLTRVHCRLTAIPHTSHRIDSVIIESDGKRYSASDIDGIDFNRYFQTEDEGIVDLEIDFPPVKRSGKMFLSLFTPRGVCRFKLSGK